MVIFTLNRLLNVIKDCMNSGRALLWDVVRGVYFSELPQPFMFANSGMSRFFFEKIYIIFNISTAVDRGYVFSKKISPPKLNLFSQSEYFLWGFLFDKLGKINNFCGQNKKMVCRDLNPNHDVNFQHYKMRHIKTVE